VIFGVGTIITLVALRRAPMGREDEDGFHFLESSQTPEVSAAKEDRQVTPGAVWLA
jgi:hypothetical protein